MSTTDAEIVNWTPTPPTEPGKYYWREKPTMDWEAKTVFEDLTAYSNDLYDDKIVHVITLGGEWGGHCPAPGTTFSVEEIKEWILGELIHDGNGNEPEMFKEKNRHTRFLAGYLDDKEDGLAAVTERHRKEQG